MVSRHILLTLATLLVLAPAGVFSAELPVLLRNHFEQVQPIVPVAGLAGSVRLQRLYQQRDYQPLWIGAQELSETGRVLVRWLSSVADEGLDPDDYHIPKIRKFTEDQSQNSLLKLELTLSDALLRYSKHLQYGRLARETADPDWHIEEPAEDMVAAVAKINGIDQLQQYIDLATPGGVEYQRLSNALQRYRHIEQKGSWPVVPEGPSLHVGTRHQRIISLRNRLRSSGDYDAEMQADPYFFDTGIERALLRFQTRHGLRADGKLDDRTVAVLNVSLSHRIAQIKVAMERWRWLPRELGREYLWVNIAGAELQVVKDDVPVLSMLTVVGRPDRPTPSFSSVLDRLVINPDWTVPRKIAVADILPQQQFEPAFLQRKKFRVFAQSTEGPTEIAPEVIDWSGLDRNHFPYVLRQDPGPANSLGRLKILFANSFDIYLHDTPEKWAFYTSTRAFSSGCVRVEKPVVLANYLLEREVLTGEEDAASRMANGNTSTTNLRDQLPVYLVYMTSWVGADGTIHFRPDIYGRDMRLQKFWSEDQPAKPLIAAIPSVH